MSDKHLVRVSAQLQEPLGLVMEWAEGAPMALKPNHEVGIFGNDSYIQRSFSVCGAEVTLQ